MVFWSDALDIPSVLNAYYVLPASAFHKNRRLWFISMKLGEHMPHSMLTVHVTRPFKLITHLMITGLRLQDHDKLNREGKVMDVFQFDENF